MAHDSNRARPVQLHVIHDLGGGSAKWLADFCKADSARTNLVLRSFAHDAAMGAGVALYADAAAETPLRAWKFAEHIAATVPYHAGYRAALDEIVAAHGVQAIVVSSLIGHSLEVLDTGLPTLVVCHDYFPWCPAINLYYDGVCRRCDGARVADCHENNADYNAFAGFDAPLRIAVRDRYVELVHRPHVKIVAPSDSVGGNLKRLEPRFADVAFTTIAHGYDDPLPHVDRGAFPGGDRLRLVVLGQISRAKGLHLLLEAMPELTRFADVHLLGCREAGDYFRQFDDVYVIADYEVQELPGHLKAIRPHLGVLASVVSETFGYALSELFMMGLPVAATNVGAFAERIRVGENGYLFEPTVAGLVATLRAADADRAGLARMSAALRAFRHRSAADMVADYHRLAPLLPTDVAVAAPVRALDPAQASEAMTIAGMWKEVRNTHVQLMVAVDAHRRAEKQHRQEMRALEEELARARADIAKARASMALAEMALQEAGRQLQDEGAKLAEIYRSTSWRVSWPIRWLGTRLPALRPLRNIGLSRSPARGPSAVPPPLPGVDPWRQYRDAFERDVRPRLAQRAAALARRPLISVIVPTFDTAAGMLREMLDSVRGQLYAEWELCVADDGSSAPHVRATLEEYAALDPRVRVTYGAGNRGVSNASNRALSQALGEYVVLLDHDDVLEEQALLRVAEAILEDDPDMVYSDEVLVSPDGRQVQRYAFRPAFSPEHLRSHPYIVHLVGLRASLAREIGGWDEGLGISQDYDLILRASEKARRIVHIPEILYRWRIHGGSSGTARQAEVMGVSKGVLRRHLERTGTAGVVENGASFNFFAIRYPLAAGLRVAIIIPTKNHGELLRQCIESIRATVAEVAYDIFVVDHQSDDPATREYLASLRGRVTVLPYEGPFNFSAINNAAVKRLPPGYTHYLLCNNDIEATERGWLERMLELGQQPDAGVVGAMLFYPDRKTIQHAGVCVGMFRAAEHYGKFMRHPEDTNGARGELLWMNHEVAAVTAACMLVRKDAWDDVDGFDEVLAVGFGDVDFCLRVVATGRRVLYSAHSRLVHHESFTRGVSEYDPHPTDTARFREKWKRLLDAGDPYYNPGLSLTNSRWEIRLPIPCHAELRRRVFDHDPKGGRPRVSFSPAI
jgi:GT2 family glycosyltransferase/glycosyltransferase involved in cell wall biosynthesis